MSNYLILITSLLGTLPTWSSNLQITDTYHNDGQLENPGPSSYQSGITLISGWVCDANQVSIIIDDQIALPAAYGSSRADTQPVCGDSDNGFGLLFNVNLLSNGVHSLCALADGVKIGCTDFTVYTLGQEYLPGANGVYTIAGFPAADQSITLRWEESLQNFVISGFHGETNLETSSRSSNLERNLHTFALEANTSPLNTSAYLENPGPSSYQSGITLISGWICDANQVNIEIDSNIVIQAPYGSSRADTKSVCKDIDNGFGTLFNMNLLSNGLHTLCALADGIKIGCTDFIVTTLGQEYLYGISGKYTLTDFPVPNQSTYVCWEQRIQNFVICGSSLRREAEDEPVGASGSKIWRSKASNGVIWNLKYPGDMTSYSILIPQIGNYELITRYSNDDTSNGDKVCILVNNKTYDCFNTQNTRPQGGELGSGWNVFTDAPAISLGNLPAGPVQISYQLMSTDGFGVDLDLFTVIPAPAWGQPTGVLEGTADEYSPFPEINRMYDGDVNTYTEMDEARGSGSNHNYSVFPYAYFGIDLICPLEISGIRFWNYGKYNRITEFEVWILPAGGDQNKEGDWLIAVPVSSSSEYSKWTERLFETRYVNAIRVRYLETYKSWRAYIGEFQIRAKGISNDC